MLALFLFRESVRLLIRRLIGAGRTLLMADESLEMKYSRPGMTSFRERQGLGHIVRHRLSAP
jgi:hypothetical protein